VVNIIMAPIKAITESICATLGSDCTSATVTTLSDYLLPKPKTENTRPNTLTTKKAQPISKTQVKPTKAPSAKSRTKKAALLEADTTNHGGETVLSPKERSILATEVINATLKFLSDAIRAPLQPAVRRQACSKEGPQRKTLRRSISMPQVPLQSLSLTRVASHSSISNRSNRSSSNASIKPANHRPTAECARVAFACLRSLQAAGTAGVDFPPLQLENGSSALIGKLIALGLEDLALKEVRILKKRLDSSHTTNKSTLKIKETQLQEFAELLNFGDISLIHGAALGLIISTQLHIVRLLASTKKENIRAALEVLQPSHHSSPARLILLTAQCPKSTQKAVRQLQVLSDTLLSLSPSVSSLEDDLALEIRLSAPPDVAFQLQTFALHIRLLWWDLANHQADYEKELLTPFYRCLSTFARRSGNDASLASHLASTCFQTIHEVLPRNSAGEEIIQSPIIFDIHRILSSLSQEAGDIDTAVYWTKKLNEHKGKSTQARKVFIATRLVSLSLRRSGRQDEDEKMLARLLELLNAPYAGTSSDIEDLITEISGARRVALAVVSRSTPTCSAEYRLQDSMRQMCESLILLCPRICLGYLGAPLPTDPTTKEIIKFEQKRLFISKSAQHTVDSTLFLIKALLSENRSNWEMLDSKLQECLLLINRLDIAIALPKAGSPAPQSYYVKVSNLYYTYFLNERRNPDGPKDSQQLRVLRRSVDCVGGRSSTEKKAAMYTTKLERMADIYKTAGKYHELFEIYKGIQQAQISEGILTRVASAIETGPLRLAWENDESCALLGRTVHILLKIQVKYLQEETDDLAGLESLPEDEQAAILEHRLVYLRSQARHSSILTKLQSRVLNDLLAVYDGKQYPLRRLRVLIERLEFEIEHRENDVNKIFEEIALASSEIVRLEGSRDYELRQFWLHLRTLALSTSELQQKLPQVDLLKSYVATWSSIEKESKDSDSLRQRVEDTAGLVNHLRNIGIYCQIKGQEDFRATVLSLIADLHAKTGATSSSADDVVSNLADLGAQWLKIGYSKKAGFALDKAQGFVEQSDVLRCTVLKLHIRYADYLRTIGNLDKR
jgi:separase